MSNALKKISARAKQLQKKKPGAKWTNLIKEAGREYRAGKLGSTVKKKVWQTGKSVKKNDEDRKAKKPGVRKSASGKRYTERRKNRSDLPGKLSGITTGSLSRELINRKRDQLARALLQKETATTRKSFKNASNRVTELKAALRKLQ